MVLRKHSIKKAFSRSARTYDAHADVQKESAERLMAYGSQYRPGSILEIGCATGNYTLMLADRFPHSSITSIDFSETMIKTAESKLSGHKNVRFICADAEDFLKKSNKPFDLVTSNATLQWFSSLRESVKKISDSLSDRGLFVCSVFGPQTLYELGLALRHVSGKQVSLPAESFPDKKSLISLFADSYKSVELNEIKIIRNYSSTLQLLSHIKNTGTTGGLTLRPAILTRSRINAMDVWFLKNHGKCKATYQIFIIKTYKQKQ